MRNHNEYEVAMKIGQMVFEEIKHWDYYSKNSVGIKLQSSADYIAVFIAKSNQATDNTTSGTYYQYTKGVIFETKTWLNKAHQRHLIGSDEFTKISEQLTELYQKLKMMQLKSTPDFTHK